MVKSANSNGQQWSAGRINHGCSYHHQTSTCCCNVRVVTIAGLKSNLSASTYRVGQVHREMTGRVSEETDGHGSLKDIPRWLIHAQLPKPIVSTSRSALITHYIYTVMTLLLCVYFGIVVVFPFYIGKHDMNEILLCWQLRSFCYDRAEDHLPW